MDDAVGRVRVWWRAVRPPPTLGHRLDVAYTTAIVTAIFGAMAYGTASSALAQVVTPEWLSTYGPSLAVVALVVAGHWGAYQGPVVFTVPDVAWLLGAPLSRRALTLRRLAGAHVMGAVAGAVVAAVLLVGLGGEGRGVDPGQVAAVVVALAELGLLAVAAAWAVQRSVRAESALRRAGWPVAAAAAVLAATGVDTAIASAAALVALTPLTVVAVAAALRSCGDCPAERHLRRAEARSTAVASLASLDARTARQGLARAAERRSSFGLATDLRRLRAAARGRPPLVIGWRDTVAVLGSPVHTLEALTLVAGGTGLAALAADKPAAVAAGVLIIYLGAALLLAPLRVELDASDRPRVLLVPRLGEVVLAHALVPVTLATAAAALAAGGCAIGGADPAAAVVAVTLVPLVTACAAMSARRGGRLPVTVMARSVAADPSGGAVGVLGWFAWWPSVATVAGTGPVVATARSGPGAVVPAVAWVAACAALIAALLRRDPEA